MKKKTEVYATNSISLEHDFLTRSKKQEEKSNIITTHSVSYSNDAENNWVPQYNATSNSSYRITLSAWFKSRKDILTEYSERNNMTTMPDVSDVTKCRISWIDASSTVKGHSVTTNTHNYFYLWPQSEYKIQVKVVSEDTAYPRSFNLLHFNATDFHNEWKNNQTNPSNPYSYSATSQSEELMRSPNNAPHVENIRD